MRRELFGEAGDARDDPASTRADGGGPSSTDAIAPLDSDCTPQIARSALPDASLASAHASPTASAPVPTGARTRSGTPPRPRTISKPSDAPLPRTMFSSSGVRNTCSLARGDLAREGFGGLVAIRRGDDERRPVPFDLLALDPRRRSAGRPRSTTYRGAERHRRRRLRSCRGSGRRPAGVRSSPARPARRGRPGCESSRSPEAPRAPARRVSTRWDRHARRAPRLARAVPRARERAGIVGPDGAPTRGPPVPERRLGGRWRGPARIAWGTIRPLNPLRLERFPPGRARRRYPPFTRESASATDDGNS